MAGLGCNDAKPNSFVSRFWKYHHKSWIAPETAGAAKLLPELQAYRALDWKFGLVGEIPRWFAGGTGVPAALTKACHRLILVMSWATGSNPGLQLGRTP